MFRTDAAAHRWMAETVFVGFIPCWIDDAARPVPLREGAGDSVVDYVRAIGREAGLTDLDLRWDGRRVVVNASDAPR